MSMVRRGNVNFLHKPSATVVFHRCDGSPVKLFLRTINCFEEHQLPDGHPITIVYWDIASSTAIRETFLEFDFLCRNQEVRCG